MSRIKKHRDKMAKLTKHYQELSETKALNKMPKHLRLKELNKKKS